MDILLVILSIVILIFSVIVHEVSHGYVAYLLGDPTAHLKGRLTLNPIKHIDLYGSIILPILLLVVSGGSFVFGWAKPVPYNPYNIKNRRQGEFLIAAAGPASNLFIALIFGLLLRFTAIPDASGMIAATSYVSIVTTIVIINITLAIFNLIPLPPLDGSKLILPLLSNQYGPFRQTLERIGPIFVLIAVFLIWQFIYPVVPWVFRVITGIGM